jgi:phosphatidylinositol glycan class M
MTTDVVQGSDYIEYEGKTISSLCFRRFPFLLGLSLRVLICLTFPALFDNGVGVQYTDIDYNVFTDAARLVQDGQSPYSRHTYRYTPFLAAILAAFGNSILVSSRILFCCADALCGYIIFKLRIASRMRSYYSSTRANPSTTSAAVNPVILPSDSLWWLYNPLPINICTRGSAESLVVLLPVLLCVAVATWHPSYHYDMLNRRSSSISNGSNSRSSEYTAPTLLQPVLCGILLGAAIHLKIYPIIYTLSFMIYFSRREYASCWQNPAVLYNPNTCNKIKEGMKFLFSYLSLWARRLLRPPSLLLFIFTFGSFILLTVMAVKLYGVQAWDQGIAYHASRVDHRHNYSMYWYWIYLLRARSKPTIMNTDDTRDRTGNIFGFGSHILFLPQISLLLVSSLVMAPNHLELTLFCQTFLFVACNKVITGQYFTWYLVLLPLCLTDNVEWMKRPKSLVAFSFFGLAIILWLASAYCLEMLGWPVHLQVWMASVLFFIANVNLLGVILDGCYDAMYNNGDLSLIMAAKNTIKQKNKIV